MSHQVIAEITVAPTGSGTSVSPFVRAVLEVIKKTPGVTFQVSAMGTVVQGPLDTILKMTAQMHEVPFTMGAQRVNTLLRIDDRRDKEATIQSKLKAVGQG
jgi:uncharacterized protein (TIGR00106 family)